MRLLVRFVTMPLLLLLAMSHAKADEVIVFYPTSAHLDEEGANWVVPIHGVIFEPEEDSIRRSLIVSATRRVIGVESDTPESEVFDRRMRLFLVDHERGKEISIRLGSKQYELDSSQPNGHFRGEYRVSVEDLRPKAREEVRTRSPGNDSLDTQEQDKVIWVPFEAIIRDADQDAAAGRVQLIGPSGVSVISDIDDTIKVSQIGNRAAMLANTFLREFRPVPDMADLYSDWAQQGAAFHYVSGSPWQLYGLLADFLEEHGFPAGSMHLKLFRLTDSTALNLVLSQEGSKLQAIEPILAAYPRRRFVLVGDSGEEDPEIYGKIAREYNEQIVAIAIRNVTGEAADGERFQEAFEKIDQHRWCLFDRPEELAKWFAEKGAFQGLSTLSEQ